MKTPMQEHIEWIKKERGEGRIMPHIANGIINHAELMLEKEKEVICAAWDDGAGNEWAISDVLTKSSQYYERTFNTEN